jgi:phage tail protein X
MTTTFETIIVQSDAMPIDLLVWRRFRSRTPGLVERILALNTNLADKGEFIPVGTAVVIPIDAPEKTPVQRQVVRLWGK